MSQQNDPSTAHGLEGASEFPITVLLIDDQAIIGEAVRKMLEGEEDITLHFCQDPTKALEMANQTDPTVIYGMGERYKGNIRKKDLLNDTPYNTYTRFGLPPTPIAMPGRDAIYASLHPDDSRSIYFVAKGDGSHHFSSSLEEHNEAVKRYQLRGNRRPVSTYRSSPQ